MSATLLAGKPAAEALLASLKADIKKLNPKLVVVQVGEDPASSSYIKQKIKSCEAVGMRSEHMHLSAKTTLKELMAIIGEPNAAFQAAHAGRRPALNDDPDVTGFIVQLPLPKQLEKHVPAIIKAIDPMKDVDGFGAYNLGKTFLSLEFEHLPPATPAGVIELLKFYKIEIEGKNAVILGRSNIVGKPLAVMLLNRNATVTVCHSHTENLASFAKNADLLFCAVGLAKMVTADMVKKGAVVIDIGVSRVAGKLQGDVDFEAVKEVASAITPVPGGVGPMTVASLIRNCVTAKKRQMEAE